ncbi:MAG: amidohydrolase family protein [Methanobacteriaceae archaeon]|nr:amidohydrolase family protein [Methanobacteriaceae archaeon]
MENIINHMLVIENGLILYGEELEPLKASVVIEEDQITDITTSKVYKGKKIDANGSIIAPALVNSHIHLGDSVAKDLGDGKDISDIVKPPNGLKHKILAETSSEDIVASMKESIIEMLSTGTTTFIDFREGGLEGINLIKEATEDLPIKKIVLGRDGSFMDDKTRPKLLRETIIKLLKSCDGIAASGLGEISDETASIITDECRKQGKISAIHVAEYEELQINSLNEYGATEVARALQTGFNMLVHLTEPLSDDLKLLSSSNPSVVCCPRSNGALNVGIPPIKELHDHGINLLLGTDNVMFNSPNMLQEMEYSLKVTRGYYKQYFSPEEIFKMATVNAGKALDMNIGYLKEGMAADLIIIKQNSLNPILSIINRTNKENIKFVISDGNIFNSQI